MIVLFIFDSYIFNSNFDATGIDEIDETSSVASSSTSITLHSRGISMKRQNRMGDQFHFKENELNLDITSRLYQEISRYL